MNILQVTQITTSLIARKRSGIATTSGIRVKIARGNSIRADRYGTAAASWARVRMYSTMEFRPLARLGVK